MKYDLLDAKNTRLDVGLALSVTKFVSRTTPCVTPLNCAAVGSPDITNVFDDVGVMFRVNDSR